MPNQYRSILKATSIFGGTQFVQILVGLVRSKFVAIYVGTIGMGLNSIYMSSLWIFITIFGMGINMSVVKDLSKAYDTQDWETFSKIVRTFRHILLLSGVLGTFCVIAFSPLLSRWTFEDDEHVASFAFLSLMVLFTLLSQGNTAILVGSRRIKTTATCSLVGSIVSLIVTIPFFYFWRLDGIVPGIVFSTISNYIITYYYAKKVKLERVSLSIREQFTFSRSLIVLGMTMVIGCLLANLSNYLVNLSVARLGNLSDLGLYGAGFSITIQTITMVFASMGSDYFPRLSAAMGDRDRMNQTINEQSEILLLLTTPILAVFMIVAPIVVRLLLSVEFLPVTGFIRILCFGMLLRAGSYALGYASFAKGDRNVYLLVEGFYANFANILFVVIMYYFWGLNGMAWAFVLNYTLYYLLIRYIDTRRYGYQISTEVLKLGSFSMVSLLLLLCISYVLPKVWYFSIGSVFAFFVCFYYLRILAQKTDVFNNLICLFKSKVNL